MLQTFKNAWKVPDIRKKILFTLMILLLYRIGAALYVPYVNLEAISDNMTSTQLTSGVFGLINLFSGGSFEKATLFALNVAPYITASIVMQLLTIAIPALERLSKDGEEGRKKITSYTRIVTIVLALVTAYGYVNILESDRFLLINKQTNATQYYFGMAVMIACFCLGATLIMWLAEQIDAKGIGNGISMILFANIVSRGSALLSSMINMLKTVPEGLRTLFEGVSEQQLLAAGYGEWRTGGSLVIGIVELVFSVLLTVVMIGLIVWFTNSERRIPIQYAKRVVGRKMYGGQASNLPLKMNMAGVMPVIFASSIVSIPGTIAGFLKGTAFYTWVNNWFSPISPIYIVLFLIMIFLFSYFYIMISFNPVEVANNIRSQGGSIPGIRPGKPTSDYIKKILNRVTLLGAIFLAVLSGVPMIVGAFATNFTSIAFGGTSLLIVVGVALETVRDMEAQLKMRNYKGFLD